MGLSMSIVIIPPEQSPQSPASPTWGLKMEKLASHPETLIMFGIMAQQSASPCHN